MEKLRQRRADLRDRIVAGRTEAVERQHRMGKHTARERLDLLLDPGSFIEIDMFRRRTDAGDTDSHPYTDGVVAGCGEVAGRRVFVYAQDFTIAGGSLGAAHAAKIHKTMDLALSTGSPIVALNDSGGARIQEGAMALDGFGGIFRRHVAGSGVIPQINVVMGPCAGGAAYSPALADFTFMVRETAQLYLTGPDVVAAVTGERVDHNELGGADVHGRRSGVASFVHADEIASLAEVRRLLALLPSNNLESPPATEKPFQGDDLRPALARIVPTDSRKSYDIKKVIRELVDDRDYLLVHSHWARNVVCALARVRGQVVGIVGNQPMVMAGALDSAASQKAARFVRFCDAFSIPLVTLVDVPGFLPGTEQEAGGVIRHGAKLLYAYCDATVPRIQVILRKAYGGAYIVMDSRSIGCDLSLTWPTNEIAVMGPEGAIDVLHRRELAAAADPQAIRGDLIARYREELIHPYFAAERGLTDDVIDPAHTRVAIVRGLSMLRNKRPPTINRKHGNVPL